MSLSTIIFELVNILLFQNIDMPMYNIRFDFKINYYEKN